MEMDEQAVGIIGGTGFYDLPGINWETEKQIETPFGNPSDRFRIGYTHGLKVVFLPRHGRNHSVMPSEINHRANIYGMKSLGVEWLITTSAVGSFQEELPPKDLVLVDQYFDRTKNGKQHTFFGNGVIAHIGFANPVCHELSEYLYENRGELGNRLHKGGTYVNIEGPAFSTRAESILYKKWGMDVIGMTGLIEAKLAREAEICFSTIAIVTDFDSWHEDLEAVSTAAVLENFQQAVGDARTLVSNALQNFPLERTCQCQHALKDALITDLSQLDQDAKLRMGIFLEKYIHD